MCRIGNIVIGGVGENFVREDLSPLWKSILSPPTVNGVSEQKYYFFLISIVKYVVSHFFQRSNKRR